ncbi:MAG: Gldg family protein [Myxococcales bacterium]|nr:Gldg family protein [Myxococcales bacterium]
MRTTSPWWLSLVLGLGLLALLLGQRIFYDVESARQVMTWAGALLVVVAIALRVIAWQKSHGARRAVERTLLWCHLGILLALLLYAVGTAWGRGVLGLGEHAAGSHAGLVLTVLWVLVMFASLVPLVMVETALGSARRQRFEFLAGTKPAGDGDGLVEHQRVREMALAGLSVALAMGFLMTTCGVAGERNVRKDVSYFKTSSPGESTAKIVSLQPQPVTVLLFFPAVNEVKDEVTAYFQELARATGKITIEARDRLVDASLAQKYRVVKDGAVVLVRGDKFELIDVDTDIQKARRQSGKLRKFDREVNSRLLKLVREKRKVYITVGHGELNDPESTDPLLKGRLPARAATLLRRLLGELNYELKDLLPADLARGVPEDATVVMTLSPSSPLSPQELAALDAYLLRGGRLLAALDPTAVNALGPLEARLGLAFDNHVVVSDDSREFMPQTGTPADRKFLITNQFSAHASTTSLSRAARGGMLFIEAGSLVERPFDSGASGGVAPKRTFVIRSGDKSFVDLNGNFAFDAASEKRGKQNLAAAIEGPIAPAAAQAAQGGDPISEAPPSPAAEAPGHGPGDGHAHKPVDGAATPPAASPAHSEKPAKPSKPADAGPTDYRAFIVADADLFADLTVNNRGVVYTQMLGAPILDDAMKWLGGDEAFAGEVVDEDDKPLEHSKSKDAAWFLLTIIGVPLFVFGAGMLTTRRRTSEVKL